MADKTPGRFANSGWRGGIGIAFGQPATKIPDITELGLAIVWGYEDSRRAAFLDLAVFRYWGCTVELCLKDREGRYDFSRMEDKDEAARLAFDKSAELQYGVKGLSKYASVKYSPGAPYGDVYGTMDISSDNPLVKAVISTYVKWFTESGVKRGGVALDNAGKVPEALLNAFRKSLAKEGLGIATNGCPESLYKYVDFFGNEGFPFSQRFAKDMRSKEFRGILGEFVMQHMSGGELEAYLKAKLFNGIVYFGYTDGRSRAAGTHYSFFHCRPDVYDHQRWVLRKIVPLSRAVLKAGPQDEPFASTKSGTKAAGPSEISGVEVDETGKVVEREDGGAGGRDMFEGTLALDGSIQRYGDKIADGIYLFVNSNEPETVKCDAKRIGAQKSTVVFDEFSQRILDASLKNDSLEFTTPSGPSLIQLGGRETIIRNILARVEEMLESEALQRRMDRKLGLGYQRKPWYAPDDVPRDRDKLEIGEPLRPWEPFCQGYLIDLKVKRSGKAGLRTGGRAYSVYAGQWKYHNRQGAAQFVVLDQEKATPLTLTAYSKAEGVPKSELKAVTDANRRDHFGERLGHFYAMHLYLDYQDGEWPEVHTFAFSPGTHDWEEGKITAVPKKPVKTALVLMELHQSAGTAWFDDVSLVDNNQPERNLLACPGFENDDVALAKSKAADYEKKLNQLLALVKKARQEVGESSLKELAKKIESLKYWLANANVERLFCRELRDLVDAKGKITLCQSILAGAD